MQTLYGFGGGHTTQSSELFCSILEALCLDYRQIFTQGFIKLDAYLQPTDNHQYWVSDIAKNVTQ